MCGMTQEELERLLDSLLAQWENEVVEFKRAGKGFSTGEIGEYFSALSNEANLACCPHAWLVFGIDNKTRKVVGTDFDASSEALNRQGGIKFQITQGTDPGVCFNAVHVLGYGIHRLYRWQAERYFPLPDYRHDAHSVEVTIYGHVVDQAYSSLLLLKRGDLKLDDVCLLDRVQKKLKVDARAVAHLRREGLIEGRLPHIHVSAKIAALTGQEAAYMRRKERPSAYYRNLLLEYIAKFDGSSREKINEYMVEEIRGDLTKNEKLAKITTWMTHLRKSGKIKNIATDRKPSWIAM
jgi:hypothetical protein